MQRTALIIGATGLVGNNLLNQLTSLYHKTIIIARSQPKGLDSSMHFYQLKDFSQLPEVMNNISLDTEVDAFTCLGTTLKQAGSEERFRQIDLEFNLEFAKRCRAKGVQRFFLLSSMGADKSSRFFYNRVKGELEQGVIDLDFDQVAIFRPSLLIGTHEARRLENVAQTAFKLLKPIIPKTLPIRPIEAERVAMAMALIANNWQIMDTYAQATAQNDRLPKVKIFSNADMLAMTRLQK